MTALSELATDLRFALAPVAFAREVLGFATLDPWQEAALRWSGKRALWNCARQTGKSTIAASIGLHTAVYVPRSLTLLVSRSLRQSSELFRKVADGLDRLTVKPALAEDNRLSMQLENGARVVSLPSTQGTIRGYSGATLIIEDEASQVPDELHMAIRPMLAVSGGRLILMSSPYGRRGHFFEAWENGGPDWERVMVKATECPRISAAFLAEERRSMGVWWFVQEYCCEFRETVDQVFPYDLVRSAVSDMVKPVASEEQRSKRPWQSALSA